MLNRRSVIALMASIPLMACGLPRADQASHIVLPRLHLPPAALGRSLAEQQRLHFTFGQHQQDLESLLEVDPSEVRLVVQALGQSGARLRWDGHALDEQRAAWLPPHVRSDRVLDDVQFTLWPVASIRAVLPTGWSVQEHEGRRELMFGGIAWLATYRDADGMQHLLNRAEGYQLDITSQEAG